MYFLTRQLTFRFMSDIRRAVLATNPRRSKNKSYAYAEVINWLRERDARSVLVFYALEPVQARHPNSTI
jgi:hypothetical protein